MLTNFIKVMLLISENNMQHWSSKKLLNSNIADNVLEYNCSSLMLSCQQPSKWTWSCYSKSWFRLYNK